MKLTPAFLLTAVAVSAGLHSPAPRAQGPDRFVRLTIHLDVAEVVYRSGDSDDSASVFYEGEPVRARLALWNNTPEPLVLRRDQGDWFRPGGALGVKLIQDAGEPTTPVLPVRSRRHERAVVLEGDLLLRPTGRDTVTVEVTGALGTPLRPGTYRLQAQLDRKAIAPSHFDRYRNVLAWESRFVVRSVRSKLDEMNYAHHMAMRLSADGDIAEARTWLERLLHLNPVSGVAYAELGALARRSGDCAAARDYWIRALDLVKSNADTQDWSAALAGAREERAAALERQIARCP